MKADKIICILAEDAKVEQVREKAKTTWPNISEKHQFLALPLSPTGLLPVTHWLCTLTVTATRVEELKALQEFSTIEEISAKDLMTRMRLKNVSRKLLNESEDNL